MKYTLSQAASATGKNKTTIQRAIKSGKISANKSHSGSYEIDPSELHRVFPATKQHKKTQQSNETQQLEKTHKNDTLDRIIKLEKDIAVLEAQKEGLENQKHQMEETVEDLRKRLDTSESRVTALLSDQRPRSGFFRRLFK